MMLDIPVFLAQGEGFLAENKVPIFIGALLLSVMAGVVVSRSDVLKRLCFVGFMATLVYPAVDINFLVDRNFVGVPSARGFYITAADLFGLILVTAMLLEVSELRIRWKFPGLLPYLAYITVSAVSITNMLSYPPAGFPNPAYAYGIFELFNAVKGLLVFWVMVNFIRGEKEIRLTLFLMISALVFEAAVAFYHQYVLHLYTRSFGTLTHPNCLAMFIGMILPMVMVLMLSTKRGGAVPWLLGAVFIVGIALLLKTVSRGGLIAMLISCSLAGALIVLRVRRLHAMRIALMIILVGFVGAGLMYKFWDTITTRFGGTSIEAAGSNFARLAMFKAGVDIWLQNPIVGNGLNSYPIEISMNRRGTLVIAEAHNIYLLTLCEIGVLGLLAFLAIFFRIFQVAVRLMRQNLSPGLRILSIGLTCGMVHMLIQSAFEFVFRIVFIQYLCWIFAAILISSWYMLQNQAAQIRMARLAFARRMAAARTGVQRPAPQYGSSTK